jgi:glutamate N-acetyltransferase/amino-acid N-acetyltransferase
VAGVFTSNSFAAAPVQESRERLQQHDKFHGVVVNSGVANAATGQRGREDNRDMIRETADRLGVEPDQLLSASTGHIGDFLPLSKIKSSIPEAVDTLAENTDDFSRAILTTDSTTKLVSRELPALDARMTGVAKGAGMIRPQMATMLAFVFFDHPVEGKWWQAILSEAVETSFNEITVDGEMSTNDSVLAFAADRPDREMVDSDHDEAGTVNEALSEVCESLARAIVRDGEGATRTLSVRVRGASAQPVAEDVAESVANSNLLKTALHGGDPNWGRVFSAVGATGHDLDPEELKITLDGYTVYDTSKAIRGAPPELEQDMQTPGSHELVVTLGNGEQSARRLTCDLSADYVTINSDYEP